MTAYVPPEVRVDAVFVWACAACGPATFPRLYASERTAQADADEHQERHNQQPYCICSTTPTWNDEHGHQHCRERVCCECGCLTRLPAPTAQKPDERAS